MINISEVKVGRRYGDWFVRNTQKVCSPETKLTISTFHFKIHS
jgi:hypothetical protein